MKFALIIPIALLVLVAGCVQQQLPITEITIPGHPTYTFSNDVREALRYNITDPSAIRDELLGSRKITILFNGSSAEDDPYFSVALQNFVTKAQTYFVYNDAILNVQRYYAINDTWYSDANTTVSPEEIANITGLVLEIKGPHTGAVGNFVAFNGTTIDVEGMSYGNLTLASDRLSLAVLGVKSV